MEAPDDNCPGSPTPTGAVDRARLQEGQYVFPYHHLAYLDDSGAPWRSRRLTWGFDYLCYMGHIQQLVETLRPESVLEVGCGDGRFIGALPSSIERRVGADISEVAIRFARAFHPSVEFHAVGASQLAGVFDAVVAIEVLEHIPDADVGAFLRTLAARTSKGGHTIISVPTTAVARNPKHYRHYDLETFGQELASSGAPLKLVRSESVCARSWLVRAYSMLTMNRFWSVDIRFINRAVWHYVWKRLRTTTKGRGMHLVALLSRTHG